MKTLLIAALCLGSTFALAADPKEKKKDLIDTSKAGDKVELLRKDLKKGTGKATTEAKGNLDKQSAQDTKKPAPKPAAK